MTTRQQVIKKVKALGANLDDSMCDELKCEAPHRKVWASTFIHELVCSKDREEPRRILWEDMLERMSYGLEDCEDANCEWCEGI